jgi:GT2 family glycosyltransferase
MTNEEWDKNRLQFVEKYKDNLPYNLKGEIILDNKETKLKKYPHVGVIIPTKGNVDLLKKCVDSLWTKDDYPNMTIYIADTGSSNAEKANINQIIAGHSYHSDRPRNMKLIEYDYYNFAQINNDVVWNHLDDDVELLLFCNNDIELINNAVTKMVEACGKGVGTVGARLHYGDGTIQHSGIIAYLGQDRRIRISHKGLRTNYGYHVKNKEVFGNTAAFMMMKREMFNKIGGFNQGYQECFEDVELNVDCLNRNLKNVFVSEAVCYHYESQTRKQDPKKLEREKHDYEKRLIPLIITSKKSHEHFENVSAKDLGMLLEQTMKKLV